MNCGNAGNPLRMILREAARHPRQPIALETAEFL
jgi:hypothetical protein